jgi:hypothetical protein
VVNRSDEELRRALDKGASTELPPSIPPGILGDIGGDVRKTDDFKPTLNAGVLQESTWETRWLTIAILYLLVITSPVALWLLWREPKRTMWAKVVATLVGLAGYVALFVATRH